MYRYRTQNGFTLVETLVAISVLLVTMVGPMTIAYSGLQGSRLARDQLTATYLAQETLEHFYIRRDNEAIQTFGSGGSASDYWDWWGTLNNGCKNGTGCDWDKSASQFDSCNNLNSCQLYTTGDEYVADTTAPGGSSISQFTRRLDVVELEADREVQATVTVSWDARSLGTQQVVLQTIITNQYAGF